MLNVLKVFAFVFLLLLIGKFSGAGPKPVTADLVAEEANRRMSFPVDLGEGFRLDGISATGNTVTSTVTLLQEAEGPSDPELQQVLIRASRADICRELSASRDVYMRAGVRVAKRYLNSAGSEIMTVTVDPSSCS